MYLYDKFFVLKLNFTTEHVKIVKIPGFLRFFSKLLKFQVFPRFSRFSGKVATLNKSSDSQKKVVFATDRLTAFFLPLIIIVITL